MSTVATTPAFGSVEQLANILRAHNPDESRLDGRALAVMAVLVDYDSSADVTVQYARNLLAAAELVRAEIRAAVR